MMVNIVLSIHYLDTPMLTQHVVASTLLTLLLKRYDDLSNNVEFDDAHNLFNKNYCCKSRLQAHNGKQILF